MVCVTECGTGKHICNAVHWMLVFDRRYNSSAFAGWLGYFFSRFCLQWADGFLVILKGSEESEHGN
jgi:hypothetical protein